MKNKAQILADIYEDIMFFRVYFNQFYKKYLKEDDEFKKTYDFKNLVKIYFNNIDNAETIVDDEFIEFFNNFFKYILTKYSIHNEDINITSENEVYMDIFSSHIIQIMYNISDNIIDTNDEKSSFMRYVIQTGLTTDKYLKETFMENINVVYDKINKNLK
jgi:hypothetical protein